MELLPCILETLSRDVHGIQRTRVFALAVARMPSD